MNPPKKQFWLLAFCSIVIVAGCSKTPDDHTKSDGPPAATKSAQSALPFSIQVVETPELLLNRRLRTEARELFLVHDYEKLEKLAQECRDPKKVRPSGGWLVSEVYQGISIKQESSDAEWTNHLHDLQAWINSRPQSMTARVSLAQEWTSYAWKARGGGYANSVSQDQFKLFGERLLKARKVLLDAKQFKERCPSWWSTRMKVALGLGSDKKEFDALFNAAIKEYPSYQGYYYYRAWYLLPRWYGGTGEWEADLAKSCDRIGGEDGDLLYAQVVWDMEGFHENIFKENTLSWSRVDRGMEVMEKRFPESLQPPSAHAFLATLGADRSTAQQHLKRLDGKVDLVVWDSEENFANTVKNVFQQ